MTTQPINWTALSEAEKAKCFCEAFGIEQLREMHDLYPNQFPPEFPTLTLDLLFDVARREKIEISVGLYGEDGPAAGAGDYFEEANNPLDALAIAMLRWKGLQIETTEPATSPPKPR